MSCPLFARIYHGVVNKHVSEKKVKSTIDERLGHLHRTCPEPERLKIKKSKPMSTVDQIRAKLCKQIGELDHVERLSILTTPRADKCTKKKKCAPVAKVTIFGFSSATRNYYLQLARNGLFCREQDPRTGFRENDKHTNYPGTKSLEPGI